MANTVFLVFKIIQLALCLLILGLTFQGSPDYKLDVTYLTLGTFAGYTLVVWFLIVAYLMKEGFDKRIEILTLGVGCALFIIAGGILIDMYNVAKPSTLTRSGLTAGVFAIVLAVLFLVDCLVTAFY